MTTGERQPTEGAARAALYASGALSADETRAFEAELQAGNSELVDETQQLDAAVRALGGSVEPVTPSAATREAVLRIPEEAAADDHGHVWDDWQPDEETGSLFTLPANAGAWQETGVEGVEVRRLFVDRDSGRMTAMFRMAPGTSWVPHVHDGPEECYVLQGDLHVGDEIVMHAGDYQRAPAGSLHGVQRTEGGCVLLITSSLHDEH